MLVVRCLLFVASRCSFFVVVVSCLLCALRVALFVVCGLLFLVRCSLFVVCCSLCDVRCSLLFASCLSLVVVGCSFARCLFCVVCVARYLFVGCC